MYVCVCVYVCRYTRFTNGCTGGLLVESWAHNPEDTSSEPRAGRKFLSMKIVSPAPPTCKAVTWSCTGEQSILAVPYGPLTALVGLRVPTHDLHAVGVQSVLLRAPCPLPRL